MEERPNEAFTNTSADKCWETVLDRLNHEIKRRRSRGEIELPPLELLQSINGHKMFGFLSPSIIQVMQTHEFLSYSHPCFAKINITGVLFSNIDLYSYTLEIGSYLLPVLLNQLNVANHVLTFDVLIHSEKLFQAVEAADPKHQCVEYWNHKEVVSESSGSAIDDCKFSHGSSNSLGDAKTKLFDAGLIRQEQDSIIGSYDSFEEMKLVLQGFLKKASSDELSAMHKLFSSDAQFTKCRAEFVSLIEEIQKACA